jgi:asparagine synthase (glutamine-hydrolysing)
VCGLIGYLGFNNSNPIKKETLKKMNNYHIPRGPDYGEEILLKNGKLGLAHRRLSIIDLESRSHQPFYTPDKKHWIVYNGEVYNFLELKEELKSKGVKFQTTSDTEVIIWAFIIYGEKAIEKIEGIFAFVYVNLIDNIAIAVRDRVGVKPLCYIKKNNYICFSSTVIPLTFLPDFKNEIDEIAKFEIITSKSVAAPRSIYKGIKKVMPGEYLKINLSKGNIEKKPYWSPLNYINKNIKKTEAEWLIELEDSIDKSIKRQMIADVPIGAFLSGGIDSSLVTALMKKHSNNKVRTYCIGFKEREYDESIYAEKIAKYLETEHSTFIVTPNEIIDCLKIISNHYDEPFGDSSALPTFLLSKNVRRDVKVALSGDGGDEQFFGYTRYSKIKLFYPISKLIPSFIRKIIYKVSDNQPRSFFNHAISALLGYEDKKSLFTHYFHDNFVTLTDLVGGGSRKIFKESNIYLRNLVGFQYADKNIFNGMMIGDFLQYLPDDCLVKTDRASMAHSLEVRVPLLDENILRSSFNIPLKYKVKNGKKKYILKKILKKYLPESLFERPKMGFGLPLDKWLFNEMNDFTMSLLSKNNLLKAELDPYGVEKIIKHHQSGKYDHQYFLWPLCSYISWVLKSK